MTDKSRREAIKTIAVVVGGVTTIIALPERWIRPVVDAVVTPANADQISLDDPRFFPGGTLPPSLTTSPPTSPAT